MKSNWKMNIGIGGGILVALFVGLLAAGSLHDFLMQRSIGSGPLSASPRTNYMPPLAANALVASNKVTLFSLVPDGFGTYKGKDNFHGWQVLGKVELTGIQAVKAAHEFREAVERVNDLSMGLCFEPRHGLQVVNSGHVFDYVICYECQGMFIYEDNKEIAELGAKGPSENIFDKILVAAHLAPPENVLNQILVDSNILLPRQP